MTHLLQIEEPSVKQERAQLTPAIGIDLGTTHSLAAIVQDGRPIILTDLIPSVIGLIDDQIKVGHAVVDHYDSKSTQAIYSIKRLMGLIHNDLDQNIRCQYNLNVGEQSDIPYFKLGSHQLTAVALSAEILKYLKLEVESVLGHSVDRAVITVPAYFNDAQRQATKDAAEMAGLTVIRLVNEPTAAAVAYGLNHQAAGIYAIYDLGGGTFDFSILKFNRGVFQVLATGGDTHLGGDDFDQQIIKRLLQSYPVLRGIDVLSLRLKAKQLKHDLSQCSSASFEFRKSTVALSRKQFETDISTLVDNTINIVKTVLSDAHLSVADIKGVVMVGGATRIPLVREKTQRFFQQDLLTQLDPDTIVASGAALQAHALTQGSDTLLLDVVPLSLGVEMMGGVVERIIERNTAIPTAYTKIFTTQEDGQSGISLHIVQGERDQAVNCRSLAHFAFTNIPPLKAGQARVAVTFHIDADGLLTVSAQEEITQIKQTVQVNATYGLSLENMANMVRDSLDHSEQDHQARQRVESRLQGERLIEDVTQACQEDHGLLTKHEETAILNAIQVLRGAMASDDAKLIKATIAALNDLTHDFAARRMDQAVLKILKTDSL